VRSGGEWARVNYPIVSQHPSDTRSKDFPFRGKMKQCGTNKQWRFGPEDGLLRLEKADRLFDGGGVSLGGVVFWRDWNQVARSNIWADMHGEKFPTYVVQTATAAVQRCILMCTDPGDLVLDPICGSGTTAFVSEQWGRRWITVDTSRVALALARARIMGHRGLRFPSRTLRSRHAAAADAANRRLDQPTRAGGDENSLITRPELSQRG
jgi:adenine-specific DNA-methyltransferase